LTKLQPTDAYPVKGVENERYYACCMCEPWHTYYELRFDAGSTAATVGETITGATSLDTGVVVTATLESGTYAGGNAVGTLELSGVTGMLDSLAFNDNETLTGSSTFVGVADGRGIEKVYGLRYPEGSTVERDGRRYCSFHALLRFRKKDMDAEFIDVEEETET
jgi:hypothetical protein